MSHSHFHFCFSSFFQVTIKTQRPNQVRYQFQRSIPVRFQNLIFTSKPDQPKQSPTHTSYKIFGGLILIDKIQLYFHNRTLKQQLFIFIFLTKLHNCKMSEYEKICYLSFKIIIRYFVGIVDYHLSYYQLRNIKSLFSLVTIFVIILISVIVSSVTSILVSSVPGVS